MQSAILLTISQSGSETRGTSIKRPDNGSRKASYPCPNARWVHQRLAIMRGGNYYDRELPPRVPPLAEVPLSSAELAIALVAPWLHPTARKIRLAAPLLGAPDVDAEVVAAMAVRERCMMIVRYIALCGGGFEPKNSLWQQFAAIDFVLTKMMRGNDEQDMADAEFLVRHDRITE